MMRHYPSMSEICSAMCDPSTCLYDPVLASGTVAKNKLGMAEARSGGFAVVFKLTDRKTGKAWAVRVFHRDCEGRSRRYQIITRQIQQLMHLGYFLPFKFQEKGIMVNGQTYEIVVMDWLNGGEELCEFITNHLNDKGALQNVRMALLKLHRDLTDAGVAHGDIQPANMRIFDNGKIVKLLDYDGFYCRELKQYGASEAGCPNFQHPQRATAGLWDIGLDRFSFIALDVSLKLLLSDPSLWEATKSAEKDAVVFSDADYKNPAASAVFRRARQVAGCRDVVMALEAICTHSVRNVPDPSSYAIPSYSAPMRRRGVQTVPETPSRYKRARRFDWRKLTFCQMLAIVGLVALASLGAGAALFAFVTGDFKIPPVLICEKPKTREANPRMDWNENIVCGEKPTKSNAFSEGDQRAGSAPCLTCRGYGYVMGRTWDGGLIRLVCGDCHGLGEWISGRNQCAGARRRPWSESAEGIFSWH